jgi:hypothetical protein
MPAPSIPVDAVRDRLLTRGVLMSLARQRDWYFSQNIVGVIVRAALTFGAGPLWTTTHRWRRWQTLEWLQCAHLARWLQSRLGEDAARLLVRRADDELSQRSWVWLVKVIALVAFAGAFVSVASMFWSAWVGVWSTDSRTLRWLILPIVVPVSVGWIFQLLIVWHHQQKMRSWIDALGGLLVEQERRPVRASRDLPGNRRAALEMLPALPAVLIGPHVALAIAGVAICNRLVRRSRSRKMQLIERMLEIDDRSGLPMEYDVVEVKPAEIAMMMR